MTDSWPVVTDTEAADLQAFVSEYKHNLGREALWKVARIVAGEAGVSLRVFDSRDEVEAHHQTGSDSADTATTGRAPGGFGGRLLSRAGFDDSLDEKMTATFEGCGYEDGGSWGRAGRFSDAGRSGDDGGGDQR